MNMPTPGGRQGPHAHWNGEGGPEAGALGAGAVGVGGCARLPSSAAGMWSVSSTRLRCAWTLWAVSGNPSGILGNTMGLRRGRVLDCAQGTTSAGHLARRGARGGRDASWRMRVAAVTCCEADDRVVHSAALRAATPRPLDATLACHRRPTSTRRRPMAVSTGAGRRHNGASVSRTLTETDKRGGGCRSLDRSLSLSLSLSQDCQE